jgi:hypothetical protein
MYQMVERSLPAVHHHGPCVWGVAGFYPPEEGQEGGGVLGHAVIGPGSELELPHLPLLAGAVLREHKRTCPPVSDTEKNSTVSESLSFTVLKITSDMYAAEID